MVGKLMLDAAEIKLKQLYCCKNFFSFRGNLNTQKLFMVSFLRNNKLSVDFIIVNLLMFKFYFLVILNKRTTIKKTENKNPKTAIKDISPILGPDSETKTIAVAIIFAPKTIAKIKLIILDLIN